MNKLNFKFVRETDRLLDEYIKLVEESSNLEVHNPKKALAKLVKASLIESQIEELKMAYLN